MKNVLPTAEFGGVLHPYKMCCKNRETYFFLVLEPLVTTILPTDYRDNHPYKARGTASYEEASPTKMRYNSFFMF